MYLSKLILNPRNRRVQKEVARPYQMHRTLMRAFPDNLGQGTERVLYRLEAGRDGGLHLLVQSRTQPDWSWLARPEARGYLLSGRGPNPAVKPFELNLARGQVLAFRLRANPTVKRRFNREDHKRVGIYDEEKQIAWLRRKGDLGGFRLLSTRTGGQEDVIETIHRADKEHKLKLAAVQFDGLLQVTGPNRLAETVRRGVGSGKGLGFGLLSLGSPPG